MSNKEENKEIETPLYAWTSFPFADRPLRSVMVCFVIALVAYILWQLAVVTWEQPLFYVLGLFILLGGLLPYFVPTSYYFYEEGFKVQYPIFKIEKPYKEYGCFYVDKMGIMLSTFKIPRRLDSFRGQSIRFSKTESERDDIIEFLKLKVGKQY